MVWCFTMVKSKHYEIPMGKMHQWSSTEKHLTFCSSVDVEPGSRTTPLPWHVWQQSGNTGSSPTFTKKGLEHRMVPKPKKSLTC